MPKERNNQERIRASIEENCFREGFDVLGWRLCPTQTGDLGWSVLPTTPDVFQIFIKKPDNKKNPKIMK